MDNEMKKDTMLDNISADRNSGKLPDRIVSFETFTRIVEKGLSEELKPYMIPEELYLVNDELRKRNRETANRILKKYKYVPFDKKIFAKNADLLNKPYEERIFEIYGIYGDDKEGREKAVAALVIIPYVKERNDKNIKRSSNEIQI